MPTRINRHSLVVTFLLGFSSGLPLALTSSTLQAWFTVSGASLLEIGMLGLLGQPYVYKFLWAPLLDRYIPPLLGRRRGWLIITQSALIGAIASMAFTSPEKTHLSVSLALLVAFLSASQDIAVDAYRTDMLKPEERGLGSACVTWGYRIAIVVSGGAALVLADHIGWRLTYLVMAALMLIGLLTSWYAPEPIYEVKSDSPKTLAEAVIHPLREFLSRKSSLLILLFISLYKLGDALSLSLATPFLIRGLGFSLTTVGVVNKFAGLLATLLGVFIGGMMMTRLNLFKSLFTFGILQIIAIASLIILAVVGHHYPTLVAVVMLDNLCNAMGTVALVAFLMNLCDHRYTATQFALFSAFASIGRVFVGPIAGLMLGHMSWIAFFACALIACLPGLWLLWHLRNSI